METILEIIRNDEGEIEMHSQYFDIDASDIELLQDVERGFFISGSEVAAAAELVSLALALSRSMLELPLEHIPKPRLRITAEMSDNPHLFEQIREWRKKKAAEKEMPPFVIFNNKVLLELSNQCPKTEEELMAVKGFGPAMLERYGADILKIIRAC